MALPPNSTNFQFSNGTRPISSTEMASNPCTTPRRNTSRQEWIDMAASTQNNFQTSRPQTVMSPTEQIGTRILPSSTSHYSSGPLNYSTLNSRKSVCSTQPFPMAFEAQTPTQTPGPSAFYRVQNPNVVIGTTSSFGMHAGMASQMSIPFSPITVPDYRQLHIYDQSPVSTYQNKIKTGSGKVKPHT